jgi:hypothetical protein
MSLAVTRRIVVAIQVSGYRLRLDVLRQVLRPLNPRRLTKLARTSVDVTRVASATSDLEPAEQEAIFGGNAIREYGLPV